MKEGRYAPKLSTGCSSRFLRRSPPVLGWVSQQLTAQCSARAETWSWRATPALYVFLCGFRGGRCPRAPPSWSDMARILIVDDEPHMRRILAANLVRAGHEV